MLACQRQWPTARSCVQAWLRCPVAAKPRSSLLQHTASGVKKNLNTTSIVIAKFRPFWSTAASRRLTTIVTIAAHARKESYAGGVFLLGGWVAVWRSESAHKHCRAKCSGLWRRAARPSFRHRKALDDTLADAARRHGLSDLCEGASSHHVHCGHTRALTMSARSRTCSTMAEMSDSGTERELRACAIRRFFRGCGGSASATSNR